MTASIRKDNMAPGPGEVPARVKDFMAYAAVNGYAVGFHTTAPDGDRDAGYYLIHEQRPDGLVNHGDTFRIRLDVLETILMDAASEYQEAGVGIVFKCLHAFRYHPGKLAHLEGAKVREDEPPWMAWWSAFRMGYDCGREDGAAPLTMDERIERITEGGVTDSTGNGEDESVDRLRLDAEAARAKEDELAHRERCRERGES